MKFLAMSLFAVFVTMAGAGMAAAEINYPWCLITGGQSEGVYSCGYVSEAQCRVSRIGTDMCVPNPRYQSLPQAPGERGHRARPPR